MTGLNRLETRVSYFTVADPAGWRANVPAWSGVRYSDLYPGIDLELGSENGTLFFSASDGSNGGELWKSDGTAAGTMLVKDINPSGNSSPASLTNVNGELFFRADDGSNGVELWRSCWLSS